MPAYRPQDVLKKLKKIGFYIDHQTGSHVVLYDESKTKRVTLPSHKKDLKIKTFHSILNQAQITLDQYQQIK